jgi:hypothetical protein
MLRIAHIVKPMAAAPGSEHAVAQPITFASMRRAKEEAAGSADVEYWATAFPHEASALPRDFRAAKPLGRSAADLRLFRVPRPLPLLRDVLDRLYEASDAEWFVYTNVDIALQPRFYREVARFISQGYDAFTINRRTVTDAYKDASDLPKLYEERGKPHPGYDCFVFRRDAYRNYVLGDVLLGCGHVDTPLICSMIAHARKFKDFTEEHLTFHLGDSRSWWSWKYSDYILFNDRQAASALLAHAARNGYLGRVRRHQRLLLRVPLIKNALVVGEWKRLFGHA